MLFVRPISNPEGASLLRLVRHGGNVTNSRRAEVILASAQGTEAAEIAANYHFDVQHVRLIIRLFNEGGIEAIKAKKRPGRPVEFTPEIQSAIVELALIPPRVINLSFTQWSLARLREEAIRRKIVDEISIETVRTTLEKHGVSYQRTKTWKESNDPEFDAKKKDQGALRRAAKRRKSNLRRRIRSQCLSTQSDCVTLLVTGGVSPHVLPRCAPA